MYENEDTLDLSPLRTSYVNAVVNSMNHHCDMWKQNWSNDDLRSMGFMSCGSKIRHGLQKNVCVFEMESKPWRPLVLWCLLPQVTIYEIDCNKKNAKN